MFRELSILLSANLNMVSALDILINSAKNTKNKIILANIKSDINSGLSFSKACMKYPQHYSPMTCKLLEAGERAAALPRVLSQLADYLDKIKAFKNNIYKALFYPIIIFITAIIIAIGLLYFVVPQFEKLFIDLGAELPYLTRCVLKLADILKNQKIIFLGFMIFVVIIIYSFKKYSKLNIYIPLLSPFRNKIKIIQLTRTLAVLLDSGVPLIDGLYLTEAYGVRDKILRGEKLSNALHSMGKFPPLMIALVSVGEASGKLSEMLLSIADITENNINHQLSRWVQLLEPCLMIFMGIFIGGLVIAMYLPVFQLGRVV